MKRSPQNTKSSLSDSESKSFRPNATTKISVSSDSIKNAGSSIKEIKEIKERVNSPVDTEYDPLEASRYPIEDCKTITITKIQEAKLQQKIIKEIKFVQSLPANVLREQHYYWIFTHNITNEDAKLRIKSAIESYCSINVEWISGNEIQFDINPEHRIEKVPSHKKKL